MRYGQDTLRRKIRLLSLTMGEHYFYYFGFQERRGGLAGRLKLLDAFGGVGRVLIYGKPRVRLLTIP